MDRPAPRESLPAGLRSASATAASRECTPSFLRRCCVWLRAVAGLIPRRRATPAVFSPRANKSSTAISRAVRWWFAWFGSGCEGGISPPGSQGCSPRQGPRRCSKPGPSPLRPGSRITDTVTPLGRPADSPTCRKRTFGVAKRVAEDVTSAHDVVTGCPLDLRRLAAEQTRKRRVDRDNRPAQVCHKAGVAGAAKQARPTLYHLLLPFGLTPDGGRRRTKRPPLAVAGSASNRCRVGPVSWPAALRAERRADPSGASPCFVQAASSLLRLGSSWG